jgi:hypothetical protein
MTHAHDNHGHQHEETNNSELEYRKSVSWGGFVAVMFILAILMLLFWLLRPIQYSEFPLGH